MRIAVLTLTLRANYGGILQAYALQHTLERMGHKVEVFQRWDDYLPPKIVLCAKYIKRIFRKLFIDWNSPIFCEYNLSKIRPVIEQHTREFINRYINIKEIDELDQINEFNYDAIIVGSDQVWRKPYFTNNWNRRISNAFLLFLKRKDIIRISYAASFGLDNLSEYSDRDIQECALCAKRFNAISVREVSGVNICKNSFGLNAVHVLDPTFLLTKNDYIHLIREANIAEEEDENVIMCHILDPSPLKDRLIDDFCKKKNLKLINGYAQVYDIASPLEKRIQPPVESWLSNFHWAKIGITDSFHACVFAIIFNKPFIVIGNETRGISRIKSLLSTFQLENRLISESDDNIDWDLNIDWDFINSNLEELKKKSLSFLSTNLNK